ncbi:MAG: Hsp20/alpha crystallin family protein [Akkermansiaceae bacterium]
MTIKPNYKVTNTETGASISIDLPGVKKEDVKLTSERETLKVTAPRTQSTPEGWQLINQAAKPEGYELELELNPDLNVSAAEAKFENAVLTLSISKHESSLPREIAILN